ncbi:MAG: hypothetical protein HY453_00070 [Parcubacteria group bacterium]|nr:hypothetical protein [Parcubacteria group bacterium]
MIESWFLSNEHLFSDPWIYGSVLLVIILTQFLGFTLGALWVIVAKFMDPWMFFFITFFVGMLGEYCDYRIGGFFQRYICLRFPKFSRNMHQYTDIYAFLAGKFVGIPFLSYALGATSALKQTPFLIGNAIFYMVNTVLYLWLGKTLPIRYYGLLIVFFLLLFFISLLRKRRNELIKERIFR